MEGERNFRVFHPFSPQFLGREGGRGMRGVTYPPQNGKGKGVFSLEGYKPGAGFKGKKWNFLSKKYVFD
jgi:hypothetical protein